MKKLKVLIVDDSSVMRKIVERALRQAGLELTEVLEAANGAEGLAQIQTGGLDMIFSDINMTPSVNFATWLRETSNQRSAHWPTIAGFRSPQ